MIRGLYKTDVVTITPEQNLKQAAELMRDRGVGDVVVVSKDDTGLTPVGVVTDRDIVVKCLATEAGLEDTTVASIMSSNPTSVKESAGLFDTIRKMREAGVARILVVDDNKMLLGILTSQTIFDLLNEELHELGMIARSRRTLRQPATTPTKEVQH